MCSHSFACGWWRRLASKALLVPLLVAMPALAPAVGPGDQALSGDIEQAWSRLTQDLESQKLDRLKEHVEELGVLAKNLELRRLTPLASALVVKARALPSAEAEQVLLQATVLDDSCGEAWLALAANTLSHGKLAVGVPAVWHGLMALQRDGRTAHFVGSSLLSSLLLVALAAFVVGTAMGIRHVLALLWHDLGELGGYLRLGPNTLVLSLFVVALPLFIGGDPVWLALWLFALCWPYFSVLGKAASGLGLLLLAVAPTTLEMATRNMTHEPNAIDRVANALAEHRYDPRALEDLGALADSFGGEPEYFRLLGDAHRQHGVLDSAASAYREGLRLKPQDGDLSLSLGVVHYLDGDFNAALQAFQIARDAGIHPVEVNYNLALTLAQTYHFPESEAAMAAAREVDPLLFAELTRNRSHQIIPSSFTPDEAARLLARKDPILLLNQGLLPPPLQRERTLTHPITIGSLLAMLLAVGAYIVRRRYGGLATACAKCGRPFCLRCKLSSESQTYCTQCVNIFLKKDMVAIDSQLAKRSQLARRQVLMHTEERVLDVVLPGLGLAAGGRPVFALLLLPVSLVALAVGAVWLPTFIGPALMHTTTWPLQTVALAVWAACVIAAQLLPHGRR